QHQIDPTVQMRIGNRHPRFSPHGIYPCGERDRWVAIAVDSAESFAQLARVVGRPDWVEDRSLNSVEARRVRQAEIDEAVSMWSRTQDPHTAAFALQKAGVAAAPVLHTEEIVQDPHLEAGGFFIDLVRKYSGPQRQAGVAIVQNGV